MTDREQAERMAQSIQEIQSPEVREKLTALLEAIHDVAKEKSESSE